MASRASRPFEKEGVFFRNASWHGLFKPTLRQVFEADPLAAADEHGPRRHSSRPADRRPALTAWRLLCAQTKADAIIRFAERGIVAALSGILAGALPESGEARQAAIAHAVDGVGVLRRTVRSGTVRTRRTVRIAGARRTRFSPEYGVRGRGRCRKRAAFLERWRGSRLGFRQRLSACMISCSPPGTVNQLGRRSRSRSTELAMIRDSIEEGVERLQAPTPRAGGRPDHRNRCRIVGSGPRR